MTNAIGTGTVNISLNMPREARNVLGQKAFTRGQSINRYVIQILGRGLEAEDPETAAKMREILRRYYGTALLAIFCAALATDHHMDLRRPRSGRRVERVEEVREEA